MKLVVALLFSLITFVGVMSQARNACAETYYTQLINEPGLERLHSTIRRNYAAALQDDAQQVINIWLKADVKQLECIGKSIRYLNIK